MPSGFESARRRVDDDELRRDAARLVQEELAIGLLEVAVEVRGEHAVERAVPERQLDPFAVDERRTRRLLGRDLQDRGALVDPVTSPGRCRVRKPVPHATSSVFAGSSDSIVATRAQYSSSCSSTCQFHQSSYSRARAS